MWLCYIDQQIKFIFNFHFDISIVDSLNQQRAFLFYFNLYQELRQFTWYLYYVLTTEMLLSLSTSPIYYRTIYQVLWFSFGKIVLVDLKWTIDMILCADAARKRVPKDKENESIWSASKPGDRVYRQPCEVRRQHNTMSVVCLIICLSHKKFVGLCSENTWLQQNSSHSVKCATTVPQGSCDSDSMSPLAHPFRRLSLILSTTCRYWALVLANQWYSI